MVGGAGLEPVASVPFPVRSLAVFRVVLSHRLVVYRLPSPLIL
jgi:hypothetical protein